MFEWLGSIAYSLTATSVGRNNHKQQLQLQQLQLQLQQLQQEEQPS